MDEYPDRIYVESTLKKLEYLAVITPFMHDTANLANIVIPQGMLPDYGGTFVNIEGRIQMFRPMSERISPEIKPAWAILGDISDIINLGQVWYHDSQVRQDMAKNLKGIEGLTSLPKEGLLFPFMSHDGYNPNGSKVDAATHARTEYPYILQWIPSLHHVGWLTQRSENLMRISGKQVVLIHPDDAVREKITDDQLIEIRNDCGLITVPARITSHVNPGEILIVNSFTDNPVNKLMKHDRPITLVAAKAV
jgi:predicted molibdopterin-dependent oxidoreductase YjgC